MSNKVTHALYESTPILVIVIMAFSIGWVLQGNGNRFTGEPVIEVQVAPPVIDVVVVVEEVDKGDVVAIDLNTQQLEEILLFEEGYSSEVYHCSEGYPTIGIGHRIGPKSASLDLYELKISMDTAKNMLRDDISYIRSRLSSRDWYTKLSDDRKIAIDSMAYQLGINGLLEFKKMIAAIDRNDFEEAYKEAMDSRWYKQTPIRALRHVNVIRGQRITDAYRDIVTVH